MRVQSALRAFTLSYSRSRLRWKHIAKDPAMIGRLNGACIFDALSVPPITPDLPCLKIKAAQACK